MTVFELEDKLKEAIATAAGAPVAEIELEHPKETIHGDYSTNIAMKLSKTASKNPQELATEIEGKLTDQKELGDLIAKTEVAGSGFINFFLSASYLYDQLKPITEQAEQFGRNKMLNGKKIMVEYTDPNPFKEFHIGHLYTNTVGESLARLHEAGGAEVWRVTYQGDVGMHVAKSLWGLDKKLEEEGATLKQIETRTINERVKFLGQAYALGATAFKENKTAAKEITELNKKIYEQAEDIKEAYGKGKQWSLDYFEKIYARLGSKFQKYYMESEAYGPGLKAVDEGLKKKIFKKSQGAVIFPGEKYGLHTRVFINSQGLPTYEAKELGLAVTKYADFPYDLSVIVTGNEIEEYFKVLLQALKLTRPDLAEKTIHIPHGMVRLPEGKMSSRTGKIVTGEWLLNEAVKRSREKIEEAGVRDAEDGIDEIVGIGAVKYALLKNAVGKDVEFSFKESITFEGNSGPYLQYTHARAHSVLDKAGEVLRPEPALSIDLNEEELSVLRLLYQFPDIVVKATESYSPSMITIYLFDLAQAFNKFYHSHSILGSSKLPVKPAKRNLRLQLTQATAVVVKNGLGLLGITAPNRM